MQAENPSDGYSHSRGRGTPARFVRRGFGLSWCGWDTTLTRNP